ncbi:MAG: DNA (cytosine-5-)-methyltransferase [Mycobacterium gordonae]|nr:DNA (cytosine-5-)-methyltransferase [Mycobacterium gordonae]
MRIAGLFAGIGGIELGFHQALGDGVETVLLCESWDAAQTVLEHQFPNTKIHPDVRDLEKLPCGVDVLTAGFPCTDLSQAGRTAGISGSASGLVTHVFEVLRLAHRAGKRLPWLLIENVPNMLALDNGKAMAYLVREVEALGYRWAYRTVDSRFTGVPQRRRRVIFLASVTHDPRTVLFADDAGERSSDELADDAFGFYWTEGRRGLGWAVDAVPTLKGGSTLGIPSPPAIWHPRGVPGQRFIKPSITDAEQMQGFPVGWTDVFQDPRRRNGPRWKLTGNAVTVGVSRWVASRIAQPGDPINAEELWDRGGRWPTSAWGSDGKIVRVVVSEFPHRGPYQHLLDVVDFKSAEVLSRRALAGFWDRLSSGNLGRHPGFREDIAAELDSASI